MPPSAEHSCKIFKTLFSIQANSVDPDQTAPDLDPHCLQNVFKAQADDKADDIVVIGSLRHKCSIHR